jgi:arylformamidase
MRARFEVGGRGWAVDLGSGRSLAIPLDFGGAQPEAFGLPRARAQVVEAGGFVGDVRRGGGANCETVTLNPHGNGTHTECVGHILAERVSVAASLCPGPWLATVATVAVSARGGDQVIERGEVARALAGAEAGVLEALVLRVRGAEAGVGARYSGQNPAYVCAEAMRAIRAAGVRHLLLELPSVDREEDGGALEAHHVFWSVPEGRADFEGVDAAEAAAARGRTITELIHVPAEVEDGPWWLELQIAPFVLDAAPSRPILYPVTPDAGRGAP